jgi:hypothetical protein
MDTDKWLSEMEKVRGQMRWVRPYQTKQLTALKQVTYLCQEMDVLTSEYSHRVCINCTRISFIPIVNSVTAHSWTVFPHPSLYNTFENETTTTEQ